MNPYSAGTFNIMKQNETGSCYVRVGQVNREVPIDGMLKREVILAYKSYEKKSWGIRQLIN
ncbi:predicted protein [Sclerotinia sclerotiorum 1980 UF-70]|uniref:Uncharacterized protein n=1 Tax=Sclerotinia sclerotiorum (strain ATCC 18683 / 1980 / Ss-1) TaxID=665079 RepID=A7F6B6_SCLS1|nr:predicted protein [Sclerotinia sclerotiorum 1980 UF-70]EDN98287.1 predicted protein [Sclerotinia sclerotiorum 1980 UF-70]